MALDWERIHPSRFKFGNSELFRDELGTWYLERLGTRLNLKKDSLKDAFIKAESILTEDLFDKLSNQKTKKVRATSSVKNRKTKKKK
jgi:hypothetical protein